MASQVYDYDSPDYAPEGSSYSLLLKSLGMPNASANQQSSRANIGVGATKPIGGSDDGTAITDNDEGYYNPGEQIPGLGATLQGHNFIERVEIDAENTAILNEEVGLEEQADNLAHDNEVLEIEKKQNELQYEETLEETEEEQDEAYQSAMSPSPL